MRHGFLSCLRQKTGQGVCGADEDDVIPAGAAGACFSYVHLHIRNVVFLRSSQLVLRLYEAIHAPRLPSGAPSVRRCRSLQSTTAMLERESITDCPYHCLPRLSSAAVGAPSEALPFFFKLLPVP